MTNLDYLEREVALVRGFARTEEDRLAENPASREFAFFAEAKRDQLHELESFLRVEKANRNKELLEIRLIGEDVSKGSIPLRLLAKLALPLNEMLTTAACRLVSSGEPTRATLDQVRSLLDLRLEGIGVGSTRLFISGNIAPDLTGESLLENALHHVFRLLGSETEKFYDILDDVGVKAAKGMSAFLHEVKKENLSVELKWNAPDALQYRWIGGDVELDRMAHLLSVVNEPEFSDETVFGEVRSLSDSGRIELRTSAVPRIRIRYTKDKYEQMQSLHLGQSLQANVRTYKYLDQSGKERLRTYHLIELI